jgi:hypothetical protein
VRKVVVLLLTVLALSGCVSGPRPGPKTTESYHPINLSVPDITGTWRNAQRDGTITFAADSTFQVTNLPPDKLEEIAGALTPGFDPKRDRIDGSGTWKLDDDPRHPGERRSHISLYLEQTPYTTGKAGLELWAERRGSAIGLVFYFNDPDLDIRYTYLKT